MVRKNRFYSWNTNTNLKEVVYTSLDTSHSQEVIQKYNENESFEENTDDDSDKDLYDDSQDDNISANKKKAIILKAHLKQKAVQSQTQALIQLARGITK